MKATVAGLQSLKRPEEVAELRGKTVAEVLGLTPSEPSETPTAQPRRRRPEPAASAAAEPAPAAAAAGGAARWPPDVVRDHPARSSNGSEPARSARRCARSACAASAPRTERPDGPALRGHDPQRVAHLVEVEQEATRRERWLTTRRSACTRCAAARRAQAAQARRAGRGLGLRQDLRPRPEGRRRALRQQAQGRLRGRPDPAAHADAQAARPAHEEVDAVRALPDPQPAGQPRRPEPLRRRRRGDARHAARARPRDAQARSR